MNKETLVISQKHPDVLNIACQLLSAGEVIVIPTDTVYGIAVDVYNEMAVEKLYRIKERSDEKAIPVMIGSLTQLDLVCGEITTQAQCIAEAFWPGALTLVVEKHTSLPKNISQYETVGIRMPDHLFIRELMEKFGPLAVTSANKSGMGNTTTIYEAKDQLGDWVSLYIDGGQMKDRQPSTVVECTSGEYKILREGKITETDIKHILKTCK